MIELHPLPKWRYAFEIFVYMRDPNDTPELAYMLDELSHQRKIMIDYDQVHAYFKRTGAIQGLRITSSDINNAYDIAFGMGCEFEWL